MMIALIIIVFALLALSDFPQLVHDKKWYEVSILSGLYAVVFTLAVLQTAGVDLPSPILVIQHFIVDILHLGYPKQ